MDKWILVQFTDILNALSSCVEALLIMRVSVRELIYRAVSYAGVASEAPKTAQWFQGCCIYRETLYTLRMILLS